MLASKVDEIVSILARIGENCKQGVNLWRHINCDISGSIRRAQTIETIKSFVSHASSRVRSKGEND